MTDVLERIEKSARADSQQGHRWHPVDRAHLPEKCAVCVQHQRVVKLARAFVEAVKIAKWACECHNTAQGPDSKNCDACRLQMEAERTLEEVAGE